MLVRNFLVMVAMSIAVVLTCAGLSFVQAQTSEPAALTGQVSSHKEGPMEGVLVSAKRAGSTVTITVVSDARGRYSFPRARLKPGRYSMRIRAVGYELDDPGPVQITAQKTAQLDLKLRQARDLAYQLTNTEWIMSMPGTEEQKNVFTGCVSCHTLERIARSRYNATEFVQVMQRMRNYSQGSIPLSPQMRANPRPFSPAQMEQVTKQAEYLSTINLSSTSSWDYPLKTLPRPKGKATQVIITEYDLPRLETQPHDAAVDSEGMVWYADFGRQYIGKLDPETAKVVEYPVPELKTGYPPGLLDVQFDQEGNVWLGMMHQGGIAKFDPKTEKFQTWDSPEDPDANEDRIAMVMPRYHHVNGKVWAGGGDEWQVDVGSGEWSAIDYLRDEPKDSPHYKRHGSYGVVADSQNNFYGLELGADYVIRVDAKTQKTTFFQTPTPDAGPRRGHIDSQDRLWFAEFRGNRIGMFDTKTEQIQEWELPTPLTNPYDAILDEHGEAWTGGMYSDRVVRLNTKTGEMTEYLLPRSTNIRRVDVDSSTNPATFWVGNNHGASLVKVEPLE
ncbi:carboxypeptidase regulatory-like domain-containing protein [Acidobacteria bacterium AH-259-D05]|nr:carboxypeptidase regulatory-like domain-containing protein [Acidobacteria bacterium AH-259-D05]